MASVASINNDDLMSIGKWGFINTEGKYIIDPQFDYAGDFSEGLAPIYVNGNWGYINKNGDSAITPQYDYAFPFSEDLAAVCEKTESNSFELEMYSCGFINHDGKEVIKPQFDIMLGSRGGNVWESKDISFSDGLASVQIGERYGYINKKGEFIWKGTK